VFVCAGSPLKLGFLYLYGLLTGTNKVKFLANDDSASTATLLALLMRDYRGGRGLMASVLNILLRNQVLANRMPQFKDRRKYKTEKINGWTDEKESTSPIADLFESLIPQLCASIQDIRMPPGDAARLHRTFLTHPQGTLCSAL
jgi:hypothetical protein